MARMPLDTPVRELGNPGFGVITLSCFGLGFIEIQLPGGRPLDKPGTKVGQSPSPTITNHAIPFKGNK